MANHLYIRLCSGNAQRRALLELVSARECCGSDLAAALKMHWPDVRWHWNALPLPEAGPLPASGEIHLTDIPVAGHARDGSAKDADWKVRLPEATGPQHPGGYKPAALVVLDGPDPGGRLPLHRGQYSVGRGDVDLRVADPRLSRLHAHIRVSETSIVLSDGNSANGLWFAGARIRERRLVLGEHFAAGGSTFALLAAHPLATGRGTWPMQPVVIEAQEPSSRPGLVLLGALAPLAMGLGLYLATGSAFFLLFSTLSLLTGGVPAFFVLKARRLYRRAAALAGTADAARRDELAAPLGAVAAGLCRASTTAPDAFPPLVPGQAVQRAWLRPASGPTPTGSPPGLRNVGSKRSPVLLQIHDGLVLALEGGASPRSGLLRAMLVRWLPLLHSGALRLLVVGSAEFLPTELLMLSGVELSPVEAGGFEPGKVGFNGVGFNGVEFNGVGIGTDGHPRTGGVPTIVLVSPVTGHDGNGKIALPSPGPLVEPVPVELAPVEPVHDRQSGAPVVWIHCGATPETVRAHVTIDASGTLLLDETALALSPWLAAGLPGGGMRFEPASLGFAALARAVRSELAEATCGQPAAPAQGPAPTPQQVHGTPEPRPRQTLETVIGDGESGPVRLDLLRHGPHLLVAGTTGSGKSELLRSLVLGLASNHGPHELAFMLVDFKGGATLAPLAALPHVQNLVSDLDAAAARRVLEQLSWELRRREALLAAHHATDLASYLSMRTDADPLLPALVVVVDEFRVFATELPGALEHIAQVATVGRSLGIHLVLSTQRPAGTLNAQMRANISAVIALRTAGEFESTDLIGTGAAAHLDPGEPGWAFLRFGGEAALKFRVRVNARTGAAASVRAWGRSLGAPLWQQELDGQAPDQRLPEEQTPGRQAPGGELAASVEQIRRTWSECERAENPFSPALPAVLLQLPRSALREVPREAAAIGLIDRVESAHPTAMLFDIRSCSRLAVCGLPGSGIEQVPAVLVRALNRRTWTVPCFVLDGNATQQRLAEHPGVAGYFGPQDSWRIQELVLQLGDATNTAPLVLLVCGLGGWAQLLGPSAYGLFEAALVTFARTAHQQGRAVVLCGDRELAGSRAASLCESRWYLPRGAGPEVLMGWPKLKQVSPQSGRGLCVGPGEPETGTEFQLLDAEAFAGHPEEPPPSWWLRSCPLPDVLESTLPDAFGSAVPASDSGSPVSGSRPRSLPVGVCGPDNRIFHWSPGPCGVVVGHEGSGKGALFNHLAAVGLPGGQTCLRFGLDDALPAHPSHLTAGRFAAEPLTGGERRVGLVLIDRADLRVQEAALAIGLLGAARIQVVLSTEPSSRILMELGLGAVVRDQRCFVVLDPRSPADADPAGFRYVPDSRSVPGRALVFDSGTLRQVQCVNGP